MISIIFGRKDCITPTWFVYSYYHGTQHMKLKMRCKLSHFIATFGNEEGNTRHEQLYDRIMHNKRTMITECMQLAEQKHAKWICITMNWLTQMQSMNMINDKCRNDMSIMMPWRDALCDQGNQTWWVCSMSLIQEPNGNDPKVHYLVTTPKGIFM